MHTYLIQQASTNVPLTLVPFRLCWHHGPGYWQDPRMHQQPQIHQRQIVSKGRVIEYKVQVLSTEWCQDLRQKALPDQRYYHSRIGDEASQAPLHTRHFRLTQTSFSQRFRHALQHATAR